MRLIQYTYPGRSPWTGLENEIDRMFNSAVGGLGGRLNGSQLPVDLYEDQNNTYVRAELPGVAKEEVNVEIADGVLTLTGKQKRRSVTLPENVQADKVVAALENGVLTITLPKREEAKPRKVAVQVQ